MAVVNRKRIFILVAIVCAIEMVIYMSHFTKGVQPLLSGNGTGKALRAIDSRKQRAANEQLQSAVPHITVLSPSLSKERAYLEQRAVKVKEVDCRKIFLGDKTEVERAGQLEGRMTSITSDGQVSEMAASRCGQFLSEHRFILHSLTDQERDFPIAFSILAFKTAAQVVELLKAVYRPQNIYCIHTDQKSPPEFRQAMEAVAGCFPNVFIASRSISVHWGFYTVLEPEIVCMEDLWKRSKAWKYLINLTGQEYPLKTNYELVKILTAFNGSNDISSAPPLMKVTRVRWERFLPAPHNISLFKGPIHIVASRAFVDFVLHDQRAQTFLSWCKKTRHPDEHFFNSLNQNRHLKAPGRYIGNRTDNEDFSKKSMSMTRYKNWVPLYPCPGNKVVRGICILNVLNLPHMYQAPQLFANKFYLDYSRLALSCLAEDLYNRTLDQTLGRRGFDVTVYKEFASVRHRGY